MKLGYFLSSEEFGPRSLIEQARLAQRAGFRDLWISDHFHPWNDAQGHSSFVWSVIGALAGEIPGMRVTTAVTCPTMRIHPAIIAQAAATCSILLEGRFALGLGSGEALTSTSSETAGRRRIGDGFCTVQPDAEAVGQYRAPAPRPGIVAGGMKVCWSKDEAEARARTHRLWPNEQLPGELAQILPTPAHFEQASELVDEDAVAEAVPCGPDLDRHLSAIRAYEEAGFDELYVQQIGDDHERFFEVYASEIVPRFHGRDSEVAGLSSAGG